MEIVAGKEKKRKEKEERQAGGQDSETCVITIIKLNMVVKNQLTDLVNWDGISRFPTCVILLSNSRISGFLYE